MTGSITIGEATVGEGRCFVIAEGGVNHNGDLRLAHAIVDAAAAAGADAVKFQAFDPSLLVSAAAAPADYQRDATGARSQRELLEALVMPATVWAELQNHACDSGLVFLCTPFDEPSADLLLDIGVPALKIPSGELDNLPFIRALADRGLPLLISTGMSDEAEVAAAIDAAVSAPGVALFHCVTAYPAPVDQANLLAIPALAARFDVPVGWSDHTLGHESAIAAVALGAVLLERHLTPDRHLAGPDHAASDEPDDFTRLVRSVRATEAALGDGMKRPMPAEWQNREVARRSLHARVDLHPGDVLDERNVVRLRPASGLAPATVLSGLVIQRAVSAGDPITYDDVATTALPRS